MNQELIDRCPFRKMSASRRLYLTLARAEKPLTKGEIAKAAHIPVSNTATLLAAYVNPMHRAPMDRVGVRLVRSKDGSFTLELCKPKPKARRPARGEPKTEVKIAKKKKRSDKPKVDIASKTPRKKRSKKPAAAEVLAEPLPLQKQEPISSETSMTSEPTI